MLRMMKFNFMQIMAFEKATFVDESVDAVDAAFTGVLPQDDVVPIFKFRLLTVILCYHEWIAVEFADEMGVIEVGESVKERFLLVGFFDEGKKFGK